MAVKSLVPVCRRFKQGGWFLEAQIPTQNPEIPKKTPRLQELFRKVRASFSLLSCETSQEPSGNCSDKLVQMNFFILGWIFPGGFYACEFY